MTSTNTTICTPLARTDALPAQSRFFGRIAHQMLNMNHQNQNMMATTIKLFIQVCMKHLRARWFWAGRRSPARTPTWPGGVLGGQRGRRVSLSGGSGRWLAQTGSARRAGDSTPNPSQTFSSQTASAALPEHSKWPLCCQNGANGPFSLVKRPIKHNGRYAHRF